MTGLDVLFLGNNRGGARILRWLVEETPDEVVGLVVHPPDARRSGEEILDAIDLPDDRILRADRLDDPKTRETIERIAPDVGVSAYFGTILDAGILDLFPEGVVNVHPAYLPYNRGAYPNVWSIVDGTPAGATVHYLDEGIDTGDIVARRRVEVEPVDTGETLYRKLEDACVELLSETWPDIRAGEAQRTPQDPDEGTAHRRADVEEIDRIDLDDTYTARELIDVLRARTFPPHESAWFEADGRRVEIRVDLRYADEEES